jgi:microcystin-dependent protein
MSEPYVGEIRCFGFNFAPRGYAMCNGQTMSIAQNTALFAILGTTYGGDGVQTFGLPNLQGRIPMHWGNPPSGFNTTLGEPQGTTTVTLTTQQIPAHNHNVTAVTVSDASERSAVPTSTAFLSGSRNPNLAYQSGASAVNSPFSPKAISQTGVSIPHDNMQPYLTLNFCIALEGIFPPHS